MTSMSDTKKMIISPCWDEICYFCHRAILPEKTSHRTGTGKTLIRLQNVQSDQILPCSPYNFTGSVYSTRERSGGWLDTECRCLFMKLCHLFYGNSSNPKLYGLKINVKLSGNMGFFKLAPILKLFCVKVLIVLTIKLFKTDCLTAIR